MTTALVHDGRPGYVRLWAVLHLQLIMLAEGGTMAMDRDPVSHGKTGSKPPPPAGVDLRKLEHRWESCKTDRARRSVLEDARDLLKIYTGRKADPRLIPQTKEWKQAIAQDQRPCREVADTYGISKNTVIKYRREHRKIIRARA